MVAEGDFGVITDGPGDNARPKAACPDRLTERCDFFSAERALLSERVRQDLPKGISADCRHQSRTSVSSANNVMTNSLDLSQTYRQN
jgi:hypothetical protein